MKERQTIKKSIFIKKSIKSGTNIEHVCFIIDRIPYLLKLKGNAYSLLNFIISKLEYNNNQIILDNDLKNECFESLGLVHSTLSYNLTLICNYGVFKRLKSGVFMYNPHIFYYADVEVAKRMQERFICSFDEKNLKINILDVKSLKF